MTATQELAQGFTGEQQRLAAEIRELDLLVESTKTEVDRLKAREEQARARIDTARADPTRATPEEVFAAADEHSGALARRMTMEGQLGQLQSKRKLLDRVRTLIEQAQQQLQEQAAQPAATDDASAAAAPVVDESRLLQAVVDTQEEERRRIARQVHDGPAQAMANVVLQSEISERLYEVDRDRSRAELGALRLMVNKTLQELRGFIFELRPMILDDLGLVPTLRRYVQTLNDKHRMKIDLASNGRDRRLPSEDEIAIFRLIQDSLLERIEKGQAKQISLTLDWKDETLEVLLQSDGRDLPPDGELTSGLRRSERVQLLDGRLEQESRPDGTLVHVTIPVRAAPALIS
ncbi:MAG: sensor histidine kinase [Candidatus Limnocylindria bacterium]